MYAFEKNVTKHNLLRIGLLSDSEISSNVSEYLQSHTNVYGRIFMLILESMKFTLEVSFSDSRGVLLPNEAWTGLIGMLNRSEIDMAPVNFLMSEDRNEAVHFAYPLSIDYITFMTKKPKYSHHVFAIYRTLSLSIWICFAAFLILVTISYFVLVRGKYSVSTVVLNVLSLCLKQSLLIQPSTMKEKCLIYAWIIGTLFLSLGYNSVLLSFLTIPPLTTINDANQLAEAIENSNYHCMICVGSSLPVLLSKSSEKKLTVIGENIQKNPHGYGSIADFVAMNSWNIAYVESSMEMEFLRDRYFVSKDSVMPIMQSMAMRKNFFHAEQIEASLRKIFESGLFDKFLNDRNFRFTFNMLSHIPDDVEHKPQLILVDVSSAFIFLFIGYLAAFLCLITEMKCNRHRVPVT